VHLTCAADFHDSELARARPIIGHYRSFLFPDTRGALPAFDRPKAPRAPILVRRPAREALVPQPRRSRRFRHGPAGAAAKILDKAGFLPAPRAAFHPIAGHDHPIGGLFRQRLALANGARPPRRAPRRRGDAARRRVLCLERTGRGRGPCPPRRPRPQSRSGRRATSAPSCAVAHTTSSRATPAGICARKQFATRSTWP
jgi:hypothetical protein